MAAPGLACCRLVVGQTVVGAAVAALFADAGATVRRAVVTAGHVVARAEDGAHVPRKELVSGLQVLLQTRRPPAAAGLPMAKAHDDLVLAVALAAWDGERNPPDAGEPLVLGYRRQERF